MNIFIRQLRAVVLAAVLVAGAVWLSGCTPGDEEGGGGGGDVWNYDVSLSCGNRACRTVEIGGKTWMAENLNYATSSGSWCYDGDNSNCNQYGRLYDWATAKKACPRGWHLPSREEWGNLAKAAGGTGAYGEDGEAGKALKSTSGWAGTFNGNGTDTYGFSGLPGGYRTLNGTFYKLEVEGSWWTATASKSYGEIAGKVTDDVYIRSMYYDYNYMGEGITRSPDFSVSVRCVAN